MRVLATYVNPLAEASLASLAAPSTECAGLNVDGCGRVTLVGHVDYRRQVVGAEAPRPGTPDSIRAFLGSLATSDSSPEVLFAARKLLKALTASGM